MGEFLNRSFHLLQLFVSSPCCVVLFVTLYFMYTINDLMLFSYCANKVFFTFIVGFFILVHFIIRPPRNEIDFWWLDFTSSTNLKFCHFRNLTGLTIADTVFHSSTFIYHERKTMFLLANCTRILASLVFSVLWLMGSINSHLSSVIK